MKSRCRFWTLAVLAVVMFAACYGGSRLGSAVDEPSVAERVWAYGMRHPEGFTLCLRTMECPTEGIAVAYAATQGCHSREGLDSVVAHAMGHAGFVSGWLDTADSLYYFDSTRLFPEDSIAAAIRFGKENGQIAIFVISTGEEIRLR
ncbi:MAG: hypothetical protein IJR13_10190 [Bacteroidales bacterium]|nr:hypothetical protein [Bacteroidales bacterium]